MSAFDDAFTYVIGNEGGYSNNPSDPGGETMFGITKRVAEAHGYAGNMKDLPLDTAKQIAKASYWDAVSGDQLHPKLAEQLFDAAYNSGPSRAAKWLQMAVDVNVDGSIGPQTLSAANAMDYRDIIMRVTSYRQRFQASLDTWPTFGKGWANRTSRNLMRATT